MLTKTTAHTAKRDWHTGRQKRRCHHRYVPICIFQMLVVSHLTEQCTQKQHGYFLPLLLRCPYDKLQRKRIDAATSRPLATRRYAHINIIPVAKYYIPRQQSGNGVVFQHIVPHQHCAIHGRNKRMRMQHKIHKQLLLGHAAFNGSSAIVATGKLKHLVHAHTYCGTRRKLR